MIVAPSHHDQTQAPIGTPRTAESGRSRPRAMPFAPSSRSTLCRRAGRASASEACPSPFGRKPVVGGRPSGINRFGRHRNRAGSELADALTTWRWSRVPILAALALAWAMHGARVGWRSRRSRCSHAWASRDAHGRLRRSRAGARLRRFRTLIAGVVPIRWLRLGIYAMAIVDACPSPATCRRAERRVERRRACGDLPQQQFAFRRCVLGFGDLFVAVLGAMLAGERRLASRNGAGRLPALAFDLLFFVSGAGHGSTLSRSPYWLSARRRPVSDRRPPLLKRPSRRCCPEARKEAAKTITTGTYGTQEYQWPT